MIALILILNLKQSYLNLKYFYKIKKVNKYQEKALSNTLNINMDYK